MKAVEISLNSLNQAIMITSFVAVMMLIIEYITVQSKMQWNQSLSKRPIFQIFLSAFLGVTPGCLGAYTVVSLYTHRLMNFAALVTVMIATSGDEAFVMFSMIPDTAILLNSIIFIIAIATGLFLFFISKNKKPIFPIKEMQFSYHENKEENHKFFDLHQIAMQLKNISFNRFLLLLISFFFIFLLIIGKIGPESWNWEKWIFIGSALFFAFVSLTSPDHFLEKHIWKHIIKKHIPRIFLWTFGTLLFLHFFENYFNIDTWIRNNTVWILLIAILIGIIPESGPHLIFITLFASGLIPFSILLTSSIVQDGHGMLPLLAESKKDFVRVKLINMLVGLIVGTIGYLFNF